MPGHTELETSRQRQARVTRFDPKTNKPIERITNQGTKRFPRGRVVSLASNRKGMRLHVVLGTSTPLGKAKGGKLIIVNRGVERSSFVKPNEISVVTIRFRGRTTKPHVKSPITKFKTRELLSLTQRALDQSD